MALNYSRILIHLILQQTYSGTLHTDTALEHLQGAANNDNIVDGKLLRITLSKNLSYLFKSKFIDVKGSGIYYLSPKGQRLYRHYQTKLPNKTDVWDGVWRVVLYDIPESRRKSRIALLQTLKNLGFIQLQRSVWVYPYDCEKHITYIASAYDILSYVTYIDVSYITKSQESKLKKHFSIV